MPFHKSPRIDHAELERVAQGWGKVVARRVHEQVGPDLDLDADDIETVANKAARVVSCSAIADLLQRKAALLGSEQPCPACQRLCQVGPPTPHHRLPRRPGHLRRTRVPLPGLPPGFFSLNAPRFA